jgi:site-specific recombinase XerD
MKDAVEQKRRFLQYLEIERGRSAKTIENYNRYLERFFIFAKITSVSQLGEEQIRAFQAHLGTQSGSKVGGTFEPMKQQTQNYYLIALRAFLKFLQKQGIKTVPPESITLTTVPQRSLEVITHEELGRLLLAPDGKTLEGKRDRAILELLFSTGLRLSELCALSVHDIDVAQEEFLVRGKRGASRLVFLSVDARARLDDYLAARDDSDEALFIRYGRKANDGGDSRLHPKAVQRLIAAAATKAGITRKVTPQGIRHSFATNLLLSGADLRSVQALLGHVSIRTTQIYTQVTDGRMREVHKKFHTK